MYCKLCTLEIEKSGKVRPNVATFECGHEFHLSCTIDYCKTRFTNICPICNPVSDTSAPNFNTDRLHALNTLIEARRKHREVKPNVSYLGGIGSWFSNKNVTVKTLVNNGTSLSTLKVQGYCPEDFIEQQVSWKHLSSVYTTDALLEFGFEWHQMILMGFHPEDFKKFTWDQLYDNLNLRASDMLKTSLTIRQLSELKFSIQQIKQLEFTWMDLTSIGGDSKTFRLLTPTLSDLKTYFNPSSSDWEKAGFTTEKIRAYNWNADDFTPVRSKRTIIKRVEMKNKIAF